MWLKKLHYTDLSPQEILALELLEDERVKKLITSTLRGKNMPPEEISLAWAYLVQKARDRLKVNLLELPSTKDKAQALCLMVTRQMQPQKGSL